MPTNSAWPLSSHLLLNFTLATCKPSINALCTCGQWLDTLPIRSDALTRVSLTLLVVIKYSFLHNIIKHYIAFLYITICILKIIYIHWTQYNKAFIWSPFAETFSPNPGWQSVCSGCNQGWSWCHFVLPSWRRWTWRPGGSRPECRGRDRRRCCRSIIWSCRTCRCRSCRFDPRLDAGLCKLDAVNKRTQSILF